MAFQSSPPLDPPFSHTHSTQSTQQQPPKIELPSLSAHTHTHSGWRQDQRQRMEEEEEGGKKKKTPSGDVVVLFGRGEREQPQNGLRARLRGGREGEVTCMGKGGVVVGGMYKTRTIRGVAVLLD